MSENLIKKPCCCGSPGPDCQCFSHFRDGPFTMPAEVDVVVVSPSFLSACTSGSCWPETSPYSYTWISTPSLNGTFTLPFLNCDSGIFTYLLDLPGAMELRRTTGCPGALQETITDLRMSLQYRPHPAPNNLQSCWAFEIRILNGSIFTPMRPHLFTSATGNPCGVNCQRNIGPGSGADVHECHASLSIDSGILSFACWNCNPGGGMRRYLAYGGNAKFTVA